MKRIIAFFLAAVLLLTGTSFAADKVFYYHTDPAGTPLAMTDSMGTVVWKADNKPFGEEQATTGIISNDKTFVGKERDKESGLHYFGARYLKDDIGRFLAVDPVGAVDARTNKVNEKLLMNPQRLNPYAYSLNNPYRYVDADGKFAVPLLIAVGAAILFNDHPANAPAPNEATIARPSGGQELASEAISAAAGYGVGKIIAKLAGMGASRSLQAVRADYVSEVHALESLALNARVAGMDAEAVARMLHAERNALKVKYRSLSPADSVAQFEERNMAKYGDSIGPSIEQLRAQGKTWDQIIRSASSPGGSDLGF